MYGLFPQLGRRGRGVAGGGRGRYRKRGREFYRIHREIRRVQYSRNEKEEEKVIM